MKELKKTATLKLLLLVHASFMLQYVSGQCNNWKAAELIQMKNIGKESTNKNFYSNISLLATISKLFEKFLLKSLQPVIKERELIPNQQSGLMKKYSTIDQAHWLTNIVEALLEHLFSLICQKHLIMYCMMVSFTNFKFLKEDECILNFISSDFIYQLINNCISLYIISVQSSTLYPKCLKLIFIFSIFLQLYERN